MAETEHRTKAAPSVPEVPKVASVRPTPMLDTNNPVVRRALQRRTEQRHGVKEMLGKEVAPPPNEDLTILPDMEEEVVQTELGDRLPNGQTRADQLRQNEMAEMAAGSYIGKIIATGTATVVSQIEVFRAKAGGKSAKMEIASMMPALLESMFKYLRDALPWLEIVEKGFKFVKKPLEAMTEMGVAELASELLIQATAEWAETAAGADKLIQHYRTEIHTAYAGAEPGKGAQAVQVELMKKGVVLSPKVTNLALHLEIDLDNLIDAWRRKHDGLYAASHLTG